MTFVFVTQLNKLATKFLCMTIYVASYSYLASFCWLHTCICKYLYAYVIQYVMYITITICFTSKCTCPIVQCMHTLCLPRLICFLSLSRSSFLCLPSLLCCLANVLHIVSVLCLQLPSLLCIAICCLTLLCLPILCLIVNVMATKWPSMLCSPIACSYTQSVLDAYNQSAMLEQSSKHHITFYAHLYSKFQQHQMLYTGILN